MTEKTDPHPRAEIGFERRRQMQVRQSLIAALEASMPGQSSHAALLEAAIEYMVTSLTRLDAQDIAILVRLKTRIPKDHTDAHQGLVDLEARQARARSETKPWPKPYRVIATAREKDLLPSTRPYVISMEKCRR